MSPQSCWEPFLKLGLDRSQLLVEVVSPSLPGACRTRGTQTLLTCRRHSAWA